MPDLSLALGYLEQEVSPLRRIIAALDEVQLKAFRDDLTPLGNARSLRKAFEDAIGVGVPMFVAFGDLNGFKAVNDTYGHDAGDAVIRAAGKWLNEIAQRHGISAFRKSGDEFVVLGKLALLEEVTASLQMPIADVPMDGELIAVRISFGTAELGFTPDAALKNAEAACVCAKQRGTKVLAWDGSAPIHEERRWRCGSCNASIRVQCAPGIGLKCPACGCASSG